jgi:hypothetical protein
VATFESRVTTSEADQSKSTAAPLEKRDSVGSRVGRRRRRDGQVLAFRTHDDRALKEHVNRGQETVARTYRPAFDDTLLQRVAVCEAVQRRRLRALHTVADGDALAVDDGVTVVAGEAARVVALARRVSVGDGRALRRVAFGHAGRAALDEAVVALEGARVVVLANGGPVGNLRAGLGVTSLDAGLVGLEEARIACPSTRLVLQAV